MRKKFAKEISKRIIYRNLFVLMMLLMLVLITSVPVFKDAVYEGHDLKFHLGRIQAIAEALQAGQFPVRYESNAWYGHGYISSIYYGNIFLYIPAVLVITGVPVYRAYNIYILLVNFITALIGYYSFRGILKDRKLGLIATYIYMLAGYRLANIFVRASVGEYTAMAFMPLCIYGIYRIYASAQNNNYSVLPLVCGATGVIQSHIISTELIVIICFIIVAIRITRLKYVYKKLLIAITLIIGINCWFLVPFVQSYLSNDLYINHENGVDITQTGMVLKQVFGLITYNPLHDDGHSPAFNVGPLIIISEIFIVIYFIKRKLDKRETRLSSESKLIGQIIIIGIISTWLASDIFPWHLISESDVLKNMVSNIQFTSRFLGVQALCFSFAGAYCIGRIVRNKNRRLVVLMCVATVAIFEAAVFHYTLSFGMKINPEKAQDNWADWIYLPNGTDKQLLTNQEIIVKDNEVILPVLAYDNVKIINEHNREIATSVSDNNCLAVLKTEDIDNYVVKYEEPIGWRLSELISCLSIMALSIYILRYKRKKYNEKTTIGGNTSISTP